ncbi:hypothetical protein FRC17_003372 [Serendipita sp. 399]|nr:hypothetical protein FRC17_003372 [Serendipita sp. 399]
MPVSLTLVLTTIIYLVVAGVQCLRIPSLIPTRTKAPYGLLLIFGLVLQLVTYILIFVNLIFLLILRNRLPLVATIAASLFQTIPVILLACILRALHARLAALRAARPVRTKTRYNLIKYLNWFIWLLLLVLSVLLSLWSHNLSDALNGHRLEHSDDGHRNSILVRLLELAHAALFTLLVYLVLSLSREMNGFLLLPDKVLLGLSARISPVLLLRAAYYLMDTALPLLFRNAAIRILTPSLTYSADGFIWLIIFYNLYNLTHPPENWIGQEAAHLVRGFQPVSEDSNRDASPNGEVRDLETGSPEGADLEAPADPKKASVWSRLLAPLKSHRTYGAMEDRNSTQSNDHSSDPREGNAEAQSRQHPDADAEDRQRSHDGTSLPEVAIIHGVSAGGTQVYAQTGPMAPAWLLQDVVANGRAEAACTREP